jgi:hypothetical protein
MSNAAIPADLRIPAPPRTRRLAPARSRIGLPPREAAWREAMRWSIIALTASTVAGEIALLMLGY